MHIIWLLQRRFPQQARGLVAVLTLVSISALLIGIGVLVVQTAGR